MDTIVIESPALRIPCNPTDEVGKGEHKHRCDNCGNTWKHNGNQLQTHCASDEFRLAHTCSNCGCEQRAKYRTVKECKEIDCKLDKLFSGPEGFNNFLIAILSGKEPECLV